MTSNLTHSSEICTVYHLNGKWDALREMNLDHSILPVLLGIILQGTSHKSNEMLLISFLMAQGFC